MRMIIEVVLNWLAGQGVRVRMAPFYEEGARARVCLVLDVEWSEVEHE